MRIIFLHYRPDSVQGGGHGGKLPGILAPLDLKDGQLLSVSQFWENT